MQRTTGLTLGKYAPLHAGHQLVIETALREMDHVIVVIYACPETTPVPLAVRAAWIRELYPAVELLEAPDGPTEVGDTPGIKRRHERYMLRLLAGRRVTHFFSSEFYGAHMSRALDAVDRRVDPERAQVPISGTLIRAHPEIYRQFVAPRVYHDLLAYQPADRN